GTTARKRLDEAQERINASTVVSPVDGIFMRTRRWNWRARANSESKPGEETRRGQELGSIPVRVSRIVKTQMAERELTNVEIGTKVRMIFDALGGLETEGVIENIGRVAIERETSAGGALVQSTTYTGQKVFEVEIAFDVDDPA